MVENLGKYVILVCGGLVWASDRFSVPWLGSTAVLLLGLWLLAWGVEVALKGEVTLIDHEKRRYEFFTGIPARLWSAIFITAGLGILVVGWLNLSSPDGGEAFIEQALNSPAEWSILLGIVGMVVTASGMIRIISGSATLSENVSRWEEFGFRASGVLRALLGSVFLVLAAGLLFAPGWVKTLFVGLVEIFKNWFLSW